MATDNQVTLVGNLTDVLELDRIGPELLEPHRRRRSAQRPVGTRRPRPPAGGPVAGPGTATSDSIPAWLSNGEHVWTAREVAAAEVTQRSRGLNSLF